MVSTPTLKQESTFAKMRELELWISVLNHVEENIARVKKELAECDKQELDEYLEGLKK
jgi:hypothetical protein